MMSLNTVSSGAVSSGYYKTEGYYSQDGEDSTQTAKWFGSQAEALGLKGNVDDQLFSKMLEGQSYHLGPEKLVEGRNVAAGKTSHRPGIDLTFSAPKSASIAALVFKDERVITAHDKAVEKAMAYVEKNLMQTRRKVNGELQVETGGKIIAGIFRHDTSRALDPQLHSHAVVVNQVMNKGGDYTAIHNGLLFRQQKLSSQIYRAEFANQLIEDGFKLSWRMHKGEALFEIKDVPQAGIDHFSKRKQQAEEALKNAGLEKNARNAELAVLATRAAKTKNVDREALQSAWTNEAKEFGFDEKRIEQFLTANDRQKSGYIGGLSKDDIRSDRASKLLSTAIEHHGHRSTVYEANQLIETSLNFGRGKVTASDITSAMDRFVETGKLIRASDKDAEVTLFTDLKQIQTEKEILSVFNSTRRSAKMPGGNNNRTFEGNLRRRVSQTTMTDGQQSSVVTALTGKSMLVGIQGYAGVGKTHLLQYVNKVAEENGYTVQGLSSSRKAVAEMSKYLPYSETIDARLARGQSKFLHNPKKTILIVDEASMASNDQMVRLLNYAQKTKISRVVLVGDVKQIDSITAGTPFDLLQKKGMPTAYASDIVRQRDGELKDAILHTIKGEIKDAFAKLDGNIVQTEHIAQSAAHKYLSTPVEERDKTAVLTPSNNTRAAINLEVREGLRDEGQLTGRDIAINTLRPLHLSPVEAAHAQSYSDGDRIIAHKNVAGAGIVKGAEYVLSKDAETEKLSLREIKSGRIIDFDPSQSKKLASSISVYETEEKEFAAGDKVRFTIRDQTNGIENGTLATISSIDQNRTELVLEDGTKHKFENDALAARGMDHAYAMTAYSMQGATVDKIIVAMGANEYLADQKNFYVGISRAKDQATLFTDNYEKLAERLEKQTGEKISALEAVDQAAEKDKVLEDVEKDKAKMSDETPSEKENNASQGQATIKDLTEKDANSAPQIPSELFKSLDEEVQKHLDQKQRGEREL
jgi:conjugative relaxase-like TrwC/TraI family protein